MELFPLHGNSMVS